MDVCVVYESILRFFLYVFFWSDVWLERGEVALCV